MARGRKRKVGKREPNGRLQRPDPDQIREVALSQRRRVVGQKEATSELAGFPLGILFIRRHIPKRSYVDAGIKWASLSAAYARIMGTPKATPQACQMNASFGIPIVTEMDPDRISAIKEEYRSAYSALLDAGKRALTITNAICIEDACPSNEIQGFKDPLNDGLRALASHFKIR